jgi:hypothetical protein
MSVQENATVEEGADPAKYEVGQRLQFVAYTDGHDSESVAEGGYGFQRGDLLLVVDRNGCGMGIDVRRESDDHVDMVWPDEVELP